MKKTVTTILSLALAIIMVSSLSSGVILAKGDDDDDNRKKNKNKYHTVHDVVIMTCFDMAAPGFSALFVSFDNVEVIESVPPADTSCAVNLAFLLNEGFKVQDVGATEILNAHFSSYTTMKKRREKIEG